MLAVGICALVCWGIYFLFMDTDMLGTAPFAAYVFGVVTLYWAGAAGFAWAVYRHVKTMQKEENNLVVCRKNT